MAKTVEGIKGVLQCVTEDLFLVERVTVKQIADGQLHFLHRAFIARNPYHTLDTGSIPACTLKRMLTTLETSLTATVQSLCRVSSVFFYRAIRMQVFGAIVL